MSDHGHPLKKRYQLYSDILPMFDHYFTNLILSSTWVTNYIQIKGRQVAEPRLTAYYGDHPYTYSGTKREPLPWTPDVLELKQLVEEKICIGSYFNSCLLNYYRDGNDSIGFHRDNEPELGDNPLVATLSLGATRKMIVEYEDVNLHHGDLLLMDGHLLHGIPKQPDVKTGRISLTFRKILSQG